MKLGTGKPLHVTLRDACQRDWDRNANLRTWASGLRLHHSRIIATDPQERDELLREIQRMKGFLRDFENAVQSGEAQ